MGKITRRDFLIGSATGGIMLGLAACGSALAQAYPNRPIRLILPSGAGASVNDLRARQIAPLLSEALGQQVVVENRPGANTIIATEAVARAPADGHTLLWGTSALVLNPLLMKTLPYDGEKDLIPVTLVTAGPWILVINPQVPAATLAELLTLAKFRPGELSYATLGKAGQMMLLMEQIKARSGADILPVPYKASGAEMLDLIAGRISIGFNFWSVLAPYVRSGKLRALAVASASRLAAAPEIPTFAEAGFPGMETLGWNGVFVAAGTPRAIVNRLQSEIARILKLPEIRDPIIGTGAEIGGNSSDEFAAFIRADRIKMGKWIEHLKIQPE